MEADCPWGEMFAKGAAEAAKKYAAEAPEISVTFDMAKQLTAAGNYDAAIDAWAALLEAAVQEHGETGDETAALYYRYGDALLRKCEESNELFAGGEDGGEGKEGGGDVEEEEAPAAPTAPGNSLAAAPCLEEEEEEEAAADGGAPATAEDLAGDVEIAFEVLEVARTIYERAEPATKDSKEGLADCWLRLGDLNKLNGRFDSAIADYRACLGLREALYGGRSRDVADVHWCLAFALECRGADKDCPNPRTHRDEAIDHYVACKAALGAVIAALDADADKDKVAELGGVVDELTEAIADAQARKAQELAHAAAGEPKKAPESTTTIGFAKPANQATAADAPVVTLMPKRKKAKVDPAAGPENAQTN